MFSSITYQYTTMNGGMTTTTSGTTSLSHVMALLTAFMIPILIFGVLMIVCTWLIFKKANKPGWASIVPFYNTWLMFELGGKPGWWSLLLLIPFVNIVGTVLYIIALIELSKRFGKPGAFVLLLIFLPIVGYPILAFDKSTYNDGSSMNPSSTGGAQQAVGYSPNMPPQQPMAQPQPVDYQQPAFQPTVQPQPTYSQTVEPSQPQPQPSVEQMPSDNMNQNPSPSNFNEASGPQTNTDLGNPTQPQNL